MVNTSISALANFIMCVAFSKYGSSGKRVVIRVGILVSVTD
jgi:hypothetical protein